MTTTTMNTNLKQLHDLLLSQHAALSDKLGQETDPDRAQAILTEMQELLHRIDLTQGLLFAQTSSELDKAVKKVQQADAALTKALKKIKTVADLVAATSQFLTSVDAAIDIAKTLAA